MNSSNIYISILFICAEVIPKCQKHSFTASAISLFSDPFALFPYPERATAFVLAQSRLLLRLHFEFTVDFAVGSAEHERRDENATVA